MNLHQYLSHVSREAHQSRFWKSFADPKVNSPNKSIIWGLEPVDMVFKKATLRQPVLFTKLAQEQPRSLWYSPTCGPWCAWSARNAAQTETGFKTIQNQREQHVFQLALGIVLFRFQQSHGRHMHWEQPGRSVMTRSPMLREVAENTYLAQFDMCRIGMMRDPVNQLLYKKGMEILTTSYQLYS